jgi:hypothetical protein
LEKKPFSHQILKGRDFVEFLLTDCVVFLAKFQTWFEQEMAQI